MILMVSLWTICIDDADTKKYRLKDIYRKFIVATVKSLLQMQFMGDIGIRMATVPALKKLNFVPQLQGVAI